MVPVIYFMLAFVGFSFFSGISNTLSKSKKTSHIENYNLIEQDQSPFNPLNKALETIKKTLETEKKKPHMISTIIKMDGKQQIETTTEIHFKEYRKKPIYTRTTFVSKTPVVANRKIKFVYKSSFNNYIIQQDTNSKKRFRIKVSSSFTKPLARLV